MMKSPVHPKNEASHYDDYGYDLQEDFSLFLEEAKQHGKQTKLKTSSVYPEESRRTGMEKEKKGKKTLKSSLISWWKADKKSKHRENSQPNGKRQGYVSGQICNRGKGLDGKHRHSRSGPLTSLFNSTKREESVMPYMSLHQQNSPLDALNYGPLYVVT